MSTERIDVEALRDRAHFLQIMSHSTVLEQIANEYAALLAEVIERRAREAQLIKALESIRQYGSDTLSGNFEGPTDCEWYRDGVQEMRHRALTAIKGAQP